MSNEIKKIKIQERITNMNNLGLIPADEVQLNIDVMYNSILNEVCSVVPIDSPNQIISCLKFRYGSKDKALTEIPNDIPKDVVNMYYMNGVGAMPLDEYGYPTNEVHTEITPINNNLICDYKNIIPGSINIDNNKYTDNGADGYIYDDTNKAVGTVDYAKGIISFGNEEILTKAVDIKYTFDIYNIDTNRNFGYFEKSNHRVFASQYQLDVDSAVSLNDFKGLNLQQNIDKLLPEVLAQQIDSKALSKYFELVNNRFIPVTTWDAKALSWDYTANNSNSLTNRFMDLGTLVSLEIGRFAYRTGVVPNIILCDPVGYSVLKINRHFKTIEANTEYSGTPRLVGYFDDAKVFVVQHITKGVGNIVLTYKGPSDAQASAVYTPYIPVTLRTVKGAEGGGMMVTNNIYSIGGFKIINPEIISGIKIVNLSYPD